MGRSSIQKVEVRADGSGLSSRAGTALLPLATERLGLTDALGWALGETRERRWAHEPGRVFCDLAVMLADGGRCVSDLVALGSQPALFGDVASVSTARRVLLSVRAGELDRLRTARARARARAWAAGAAPELGGTGGYRPWADDLRRHTERPKRGGRVVPGSSRSGPSADGVDDELRVAGVLRRARAV